jgi:hypothetical protein
MTARSEQYPFVTLEPALGAAGLLPCLPITLALGQQTASVLGLLDTAASVNVLPFDIGCQLGAVWDKQAVSVHLTGNLARQEAKVLLLSATIGSFAPVRLAFAWTKSNEIPVLLGQVNFFMEFDVCFFRSRGVFEIARLDRN